MQLTLQLLIKIVKDNSFFSQTVNDQFEFLVDCDGLVELLVCFVESVLQDLHLLLKIVEVLRTSVDPQTMFLLFDDLLLEVGDVNIDVFLGLPLLLNSIGNLVEEILQGVSIESSASLIVLLVVDFSLNRLIWYNEFFECLIFFFEFVDPHLLFLDEVDGLLSEELLVGLEVPKLFLLLEEPFLLLLQFFLIHEFISQHFRFLKNKITSTTVPRHFRGRNPGKERQKQLLMFDN